MRKIKKKNINIVELKRDIVIERLMQAPPTLKVSLGMTEGKFLSRDELICQVKEDTEIGRKIVNMHFAYMKALKKDLNSGD